jgi:hypothetical protein
MSPLSATAEKLACLQAGQVDRRLPVAEYQHVKSAASTMRVSASSL